MRGAGEDGRRGRRRALRAAGLLYEEAAANPARKNLEDIRRGEFEGLAAKMAQPAWAPDFGPAAPHPSAGASVIGARMPLIAYNINLATNRLDVAKKIAAAIRMSSGGLRYVKAMGIPLEDRGIVQVSMNLTNYEKTPIFRVFDLVKREAERYGVSVLESEIVGLVPAAALRQSAEYYLQLEGFSADQVLENKLSVLVAAARSNAERAQLLVEIRSLDAEHFGGARHVALLRRQHLQDVVLLKLVARLRAAAPPAPALPARRGTPSRPRKPRSCAVMVSPATMIISALDHVAQLAHVAGPAVLLQPRRRLGREPLRPAAVLARPAAP